MATYEELKKRAKQKREEEQEKKNGQTTTPQSPSGTSTYEEIKKRAKQKREEERTKVVDSSYINSFLDSTNKFFSSVEEETGKVGWGNASTSYQSRANTWNDLDQRRGIIRSWLDLNKDKYSPEDYDQFASYLDAIGTDATSVLDWFKSTKDFYSQWETEDQYNFWEARNTTEDRQNLYADQQKRVAQLEEALKAENARWAEVDPIMMGVESAEFKTASEEHLKKVKGIQDEIASIQTEMRNYERGNRNQYGQDYGNKTLDTYTAKYLSNPEFIQAASNREYGNASVEDHVRYKALNDSSTWAYDENGTIRATDGTVIEDDGSGNLIHPGTVGMNAINDRLGMYISATEEERLMPATLISGELSQVMTEGTTKHWELLTEDELTIYYGLLNTEGQESAYNFLDSIQTTLDMRSTERSIKATQDKYDDSGLLEKIMLNVATFPANLVSGVAGGIEDAIALATGNDINPYSATHAGMHYTQTVRGKTAQDIDKNAKPDAFFTWGDLYQSGMSLGDSLLAMGVGGAYGGALLAMGAAENEAYRLYQQGASTGQIAAGAALAGAAEMVFESISIDKLINMKDATSLLQVVKNALIQGGVEASEEAFTEIANTITNAIVLGQQSDWAKLVEENGGNNFDAFMEVLRNVGHSALSGFFSGAGSGGLVSGANYAANYAEQQGAYADAGRIIMETDGGVDALKALAMDVSGARGSLARQAKRTTSSGKAANVGKLYQKTGEAVSKMNRADIEASLVEKGFSKKEAKRIGEYLYKASTGGYFTWKEQNEVENDQRIVEVLRDVVGSPESTINQRTKKFIEAFLPKSSTASTSGKGIPTETSYTVSQSGKTTLDGAEVKIGSLRKLDDGSIVVATADNQTADPSEVEYSDKGTALVFESYSAPDIHSSNPVIANMPVADRSALAMGYDPASGIDGRLWVVGSNEAYWYGFEGISLGTLPSSSFAKHLPQEQINKAYALGRAASEASAKAQSESVQATYDQAVEKLGGKEKAKAAVRKAGKVILEHSLSESSMTSQQKASYKLTQAVASTIGTTVHVYRGGKERGYYDTKTGDVWLNIDADAKAQSYMVFTLGHELLHKAKHLSSLKFKQFADTLLEQYGEKGISVETLIQNKIDQYADHGITLNEHEAYEEVIADACQAMLLDTNAVETMAEFRDANPGFWQKIVDTIKEFIEKIRLALKGVEPDSEEAQHFKELDAAAQKILENLFVDMVMDASQKGAVIKAANGTLSVEQYMETKDIKYNLAAVNKHKSNLETKYSEESTVPLVTLMARYNKILDIWTKLGGELNSQFLKDWDSKVGTDRTFTIFKAQSGYKYNVELSSMCKKGVPLFEAIDTIVKQEVMKELGIETLGKAEKEILYDILKSHHFEIPCAICYVEQARQREGAIIDAFLNGKVVKNASGKTTQFKLGWNEVLDAIESEMRANGVEYSFAQVSRDLATESYAPANLDMDEKTQAAFFEALKKIANQEIARYNKDEKKSRSLLRDVTPEAVKACFKGTLPSNLKIFKVLFTEPSSRFKIQHDLLYSSIATQNLARAHHELYGLFNSQGGVSGYKTKQGTTIYWGDILSKSWTPDTLRKEGGVRNQSNSDFQMYTLLDQAQMYIDFTAKGYYLQAYTKVLSELKLFGLSRGKINASLIPRVVVYHNADGSVDVERTMATAGLDENGNPIYDDIEGINHAEAFMLIADPEYSKSITGICIGYSDAHIRKLLDVDGVQLIIGFHDKTDDGEKRYRGARYAKNYNGLNEAVKYDAEGKPKTVHIGFNPYVKKAEGKFRYNEETETFEGTTTFKGKEYTADDIPRLAADMYLDMCEKKGYVPAYADFKDHRNYYKLLADFGLYDSQGHYAPHRKVAYNMPDQVPYLDANGNKQYMKSYDYIREELRRELIVRDDISAALADQSSEGIIPQFKAKVEEMRGHTIPEGAKRSMPKVSDSEYMAAVNRGDMEVAQRMVDAFALANGYIPVARYHQTLSRFTEFNTDNPVAGRNDSETPNGIFFKANDHDIGIGGDIQMKMYLKASNMLHFADRKEANAWYRKNIPGYDALQKEMDKALKPFLDQLEAIEEQEFDTSKSDEEVDALFEEEERVIEEMRKVEDSYRAKLRELLNQHFLSGNSGYDGIELDYDGHRWVNGKREDVHTYIVFHPSQAKSSAPVTYDDSGKVIPLSERFNRGNKDIRYAMPRGKSKAKRKSKSNAVPVRTMASVKIDRNYIMYGDTASEVKAVDAVVARLEEKGKLVRIPQEALASISGAIDWSNNKEARSYIEGVLERVLGVSVNFGHNGQTAEVILIRDGISHATAGMNTPEKAIAFARFRWLVANAEYAYSSEDDSHSNAGVKVQHEKSWDCFVSLVEVGGQKFSVIFKIRTIAGELRSQIYSIAIRKEIGPSHGGGQQTAMLNALPNYGGSSPISGETITQPGSGVKTNVSAEMLEEELNSMGLVLTSRDNNKNNQRINAYLREHYPDLYGRVRFFNDKTKGYVVVKEIVSPDVLDENASGKKVTEGFNPDTPFKAPNSRGLSTRELLAVVSDDIAQTPEERKLMAEYRNLVQQAESVHDRLKKVRDKIHELKTANGSAAEIAELNNTAEELAKMLDKYNGKLRRIETKQPMMDVVKRAQAVALEEGKRRGEALMAEYRQKVSERFDRGVENRKKTAMRQKIRKVIRDLDKILNRGDKKRNVKEGMKGFVEEALASAEVLFIDNYGNEDMIRNGVEVEMTPEEEKYMTEARAILAKLNNLPSGGYEAWAERQGVEERLKSQLAYRMGKLKDVFYRERLRLNKTKVADVLSKLADAYAKLETSEYAYVNGAYNEAVYQYLKTLQDEVGGATIRDMSLSQLELMHTAYKMVLHSVRKANEMFTEGWTKRRDELANGIMFEVEKAGGVHGIWSPMEVKQNRASWNNTKPIYAAERIGSETFKQLWAGLFKGQYNWALDMEEAKAFRKKVAEKYGVKNWDMEKMYTFTSASGLEFQLNLNQIMSIYAYSKREQAHDHLTKGGFVFGRDTEVIVNEHGIKKTYFDRSASAYKVSDELIEEIVGVLDKVPGAKKFVDEMQDYLSTTMGEKGNEVSLKLYGVKLFNEAFYFPLRSAGQYMERAKEADLKKQQGQVSIANSSFTHATKPKANNPVVLEGFMDVWASHVNEMSLYHSMVLPMEDFRRVYNYSSPNMEGQDSVSVNGVIENAYGPEATGYIDQLYKELNGGAVTDPRETAFKERIGKFKKAAVMLSSSVVVQQFSSIGRAYALIDPKYFIGAKVDKKRHNLLWEELKQYAPVAIIKEMGGFDTGMGGSAKDYLLAEEYGKGERIKGFMKDEQYRSEVMGLAPAKADELTWCAIWEAVKRETKANNPNMDVTSEEFLKKAGERFSEVIEKTQVYDSVLARSANMRSKNGLMQMATAFLAEPTTTVNMIEDALRKKDKKYIARTFGAVFTSIVINNALASIVYAMRDDDDDETFLEKYTQAFASGMLDDINPLTYYPFLKDVWSLLQGYDVERSDMSVVSDVVDAVKKVTMTFAKRDDDMSEEELAEYRKEIGSGLLGLLNAGLNALGIPFKNVYREIAAIVNTFNTFSKTFGSTTWNSFVDALGSSALDSTPIVGIFAGESRTDKIYDAIISGDTTYLKRLKGGYKDEDSYNAAVRKALRENDPRIREAALAQYNGNPSERVRIARLIKADGFEQDNVVAAINSVLRDLKPEDTEPKAEKYKGEYTAADFAREIANGDQASANAAKVDIIQTYQKNGKSAEKATESFISSAKTELKDLFLAGEISEQKAINALTTYCDMDDDDIHWLLDKWHYEDATGSADGYAKYGDFHTAVQTGVNLKAVVQEYTSNGVETKALASEITSHFKPLYRKMSNTERAAIKGYLLNAYALLGYDRAKKSKDIDNWLKD